METWDLASLDVEPHQPAVLRTDPEARAIAINLPAGEQLKEHQVHERAWVVVAAGEVEFEQDGSTVSGGPGFVAHFDEGAPRGARRQRRAHPAGSGALAGRGAPEPALASGSWIPRASASFGLS